MEYRRQDLRYGASKEMITEVEKLFGVTLPETLVQILKLSNGATFFTERKEIQFLGTKQIAEYYECYNFKDFMHDAIPIAMDGCGNFIVLKNGDGEKIYGSSASELDWEESVILGHTFEEYLNDPVSSDQRINER